METVESVATPSRPPERPVQWLTGFKAALGIAAIFWLVTRGIPWAPSGLVSPTVMGREIKHPGALDFNMAILAIGMHFFACMIYAAIMMPLIHRFCYSSAWIIGAGLGVILYLCNLAAFSMVGDGAPYSREFPVLVTHLAFGIVFTGAYKGLVKRRIMAEA
jgi:hypothetical protein